MLVLVLVLVSENCTNQIAELSKGHSLWHELAKQVVLAMLTTFCQFMSVTGSRIRVVLVFHLESSVSNQHYDARM